MKKVFLLFCAALLLLFASCKSTQQVAEEEEAVAVEAVEDTSSEEQAPVQESQEQPVDNGNSLESCEASRKAALEAGAKDYYGDAFALTDAAFEALKNLKDGKDHSAELAKLKDCYDAFASAAKAKKLKARIDEEGLASNSQADYDAGEKSLAEFDALAAAALSTDVSVEQVKNAAFSAMSESAFSGIADSKKFKKTAEDAYNSYYAVYFKSYKKFANDARKEALTQKKAADAVKAQVARKDEYKSCADLIIKGDQQYSTSNPEGAYNNYKQAASKFEALAKDVAEKRAEAQKAIDEAKARVKASNDYAEKADIEKPLGDEPVAGIEAEDTVLLEKDEFKNPDEEIIEIDESVQSGAGDER